MPDRVGHDGKEGGHPEWIILLFISLLNGDTGGDSLFLVLFPAMRAQ